MIGDLFLRSMSDNYYQNALSVELDVPKALIKYQGIKERLPEALEKISLEAYNFWYAEAGRRLNTTRDLYQDAIERYVDDTGFELTLGANLEGRERFLVNALEFGLDRFDMKPGLLKKAQTNTGIRGAWARMKGTSKPGFHAYRIIPIEDPNTGQKVFRTVSVNSPPSSWIHPGLDGIHIRVDLYHELDQNLIPKYMGELIDSL